MTEQIGVLLVEDNPADARLVREYLTESGQCAISHAATLENAFRIMEATPVDVMLLDLSLPDSTGIETLKRAHTHMPEMPIIIFTGNDDDQIAYNAMRNGAQDYLLKGHFDLNLLVRAIRYTIERKQAETAIRKLAYYDGLTGLPNRALLADRLRHAVAAAQRERSHVACLFLDLDRFKGINDSFGHTFGDRILCVVSERLRHSLRSGDTVARIGGDEFVILLPGLQTQEVAGQVAQKVIKTVSEPMVVDGSEIFLTVSIGIAIFPDDSGDDVEILRNSDLAMYQAKTSGRDGYQFYCEEMNLRAIRKQRLEIQVRHAIFRNEFQLHYQPIVDLPTGRIVAVESLLRWRHPEMGEVMPETFIPLAEESGLIVTLGDMVLKTACLQGKRWHDQGIRLRVCVNISARQFKDPGFVAGIDDILKETGMKPEFLELELTESTLMESIDATMETLGEIKTRGIHLAIDDFGTGYSSLSYLKDFPLDRLKIDRSFIAEISAKADGGIIPETVICLAHSLRKRVVAEGVENEEELRFLADHGCDEVQGFHLHRPMGADAVTRLLSEASPL